MGTAVIVALIALAGTVGNVGLTYAFTIRAERRRELERADAAWARQRESFSVAAEELSDRLSNILEGRFLDAYAHSADSLRKDEAVRSTLFRFSQYFGWSEIVRRAMRSPNSRHVNEARVLERLQGEVSRLFATDRYGPGEFMVWRESQRAIGELMIVEEGGVVDSVGVADFLTDLEKFRPWLSRMERLMNDKPPARWPEKERERLGDIRVALDALRAELSR